MSLHGRRRSFAYIDFLTILRYEDNKLKQDVNVLTSREVNGKFGSNSILRRVSDMHQK
jgi:hypothetical protein